MFGSFAAMGNGAHKHTPKAIVAVMGATGTGKSAFICLLTNDDTIRIGHNQESETFEIQTADYIDGTTGQRVMLIDTPGFDDSREGVTDTDILHKIVEYLEPESGERRKLNGIIYMHRISDPRLGGISRKNLRMFYSLCGQENLANVRIVTTNWGRVTEEEGNHREADLKSGAFKALIDAGAQMRRHTNTLESARQIMSELIPFESVTMRVQEEVQAGKKLADTSAGKVLTAEMREMQRRHEREMAELKQELKMAAVLSNQSLRADLELERRTLEEKIARVEVDRARLEKTLEEHREAELKRRAEERAEFTRLADKWADEHRETLAQMAQAHENETELRKEAAERQLGLEQQITEAYRRITELESRKPGVSCLIC